jgi:hypothetical protein
MSKDHESEKLRERNPKAGDKRWSASNQLRAASLFVTILISILSFFFSTKVRDIANTVSQSRVELGTVPSNSNAGDVANPWTIWEEPVTPATLYVGIKRRIQFKHPFSVTPRVATALYVIDLYPIAERMRKLGYVPPIDMASREALSLSYSSDAGQITERLKDVHIVSFAVDSNENGFVLEVGVGLPTKVGEFLASQLQKQEPPKGFVEGMRRYGQLPGASNSLTADERWLANFYALVGTLGVTWMAQQ